MTAQDAMKHLQMIAGEAACSISLDLWDHKHKDGELSISRQVSVIWGKNNCTIGYGLTWEEALSDLRAKNYIRLNPTVADVEAAVADLDAMGGTQ